MTARERILAAFDAAGTPETGVVACYEEILLRDHFAQLTRVPWWDASQAAQVAADFAAGSGLDWWSVHPCAPRAERLRQRFEQRADGVWRVDEGTGEETCLNEPVASGTNTGCATSHHTAVEDLPESRAEVDARLPTATAFDRDRFLAEGRHDAAAAIRQRVDLLLYGHTIAPLWMLYNVFGYEGMMVLLAQDPDLAAYAAQRLADRTLQQIRTLEALGAEAVWIEECLTDQIHPDLFRAINVPILRGCVDAIRQLGMKSIYYYCGNPCDRLDAILDVGADALHFEESKKGFAIDIADIVRAVDGRCVVFGNLDAIGVLERGSDSLLEAEIRRQLAAGRRNGNRFVMSIGSPVTPGTPVARVRRYADLARDLASRPHGAPCENEGVTFL